MSKIMVAFDLYGTLLSTESIAKELATYFGDEAASSIAVVWRKYQLEYTWRLTCMQKYQPFSEITRSSLLHALAEHQVSLSASNIDSVMQAYDSLSTFPDVKPALQTLKANPKIHCCVFSNGTRTMVSNSVNKSKDLSPHASVFKQLVSVDDIKMFKPAPEVYKYMISQMVGTMAEGDDAWLVSSNPFDIVGARAAGLQAAWVDRAGSGWQDKLGDEPTAVVRSLEEIVGVVEEYAMRK